MNETIEKVLIIWHEHFSNEEKQYSEFESSDIEYFVGCLLYNHFAFSKALQTMKTIDLSYDFIESCSDEYDEIMSMIQSIDFNDEPTKLDFLQNYIADAKLKYSGDELYLLNRLEYHVNEMADRYKNDEEAQQVDFEAPAKKSRNPLLR